MDPRKQHLGALQYLARRNTELFRRDTRVTEYRAWIGSAQPSAALITAINAIRDSRRVPGWLIDATRRAAVWEADLWSLIRTEAIDAEREVQDA